MKLSLVKNSLLMLTELRRPAFLWGPPGIGKSDVVQATADAAECELRDVRMNLLDPVDMKGFPVPDMENGQMKWLPANFLPPMKVKRTTKSGFVDNDSKGILFLDEMNSALPATQAAGYQLILNHRIGDYVLPKNWSILAAGNGSGDRGVTHKMPSPLANRLVHIDVEVNLDDWCDWAVRHGVGVEVLAYLRFAPHNLHRFNPSENPRAFPSPRSWAFADQIIKASDRLSKAERLELVKGTIGEGVSGEFMAFVDTMNQMPNIDKILVDPDSEAIPTEPSVKYAVSTALGMRANESNFERVLKYMARPGFDIEFQVVTVRDASKRDNKVANTKAFRDWAIKNSKVFL